MVWLLQKRSLIRLALRAIHLLPQAGDVKSLHLSRLREGRRGTRRGGPEKTYARRLLLSCAGW